MKFKEYPNSTSLTDNDAFIIDGDGGTKHILTPDAAISLIGSISPEAHSRIFRGKNLGTSVTAAQKAAIKDGSFDDLFLGDYWTINSINWRIVDMDYWFNRDGMETTVHHVVIMPDTAIIQDVQMNYIASSSGGYLDSNVYKTNLPAAKSIVKEAFGDTLFTHKEYLSNAVENGIVTGTILCDSDVELPSEVMICGTHFCSPINDGSRTAAVYTHSTTQFALFDIAPKYICAYIPYWLRDVASDDSFSIVNSQGAIAYTPAVYERAIRPVFGIC